MVKPAHRNWPRIIAEIKSGYGVHHRKRLSNYKLGLIIGRDEGTVRGWSEGTQPKHFDGELLLQLHAEYSPYLRKKPGISIGQITEAKA